MHLYRYHQERLAYLASYEKQLTQSGKSVFTTLKTPLRLFSKPSDIGGYCDTSITDDMVTDIYLKFCQGTRVEESNDHLRTLTGACLNSDWVQLGLNLLLHGSGDDFDRSDLPCIRKGEDGQLSSSAREAVGRRNLEHVERAGPDARVGEYFAGAYYGVQGAGLIYSRRPGTPRPLSAILSNSSQC